MAAVSMATRRGKAFAPSAGEMCIRTQNRPRFEQTNKSTKGDVDIGLCKIASK